MTDDSDLKITILTPTYNRAYILPQLYNSLRKQQDKSFEWLIIDDGSEDNTEYIVKSWIQQVDNPADFFIKYKKKENGGKHRAINYAIDYIKTEYTFIVDSDDYLTEDAILKIKKWLETIKGEKKIAGVAGLRGNSEYIRIGDFPKRIEKENYIDAYNTDRIKKRLTGDKAEIYKTDILRKFPFPEIEGETFLSESVVWNELAYHGYMVRWFNSIIYITEYLEDGLTKNLYKKRVENFKGYSLETKCEMKNHNISKYRYLGRYIILADRKGFNQQEICRFVNISKFEYFIGKAYSFLQKYADELRGGINGR